MADTVQLSPDLTEALNAVGKKPLEVNMADLTETAANVQKLLLQSPTLYYRDGPVTIAPEPQQDTWTAHSLTIHGVTRETHRVAQPFKRQADGEKKPVTLNERVASMALDDRHAWSRLRPLDGFATAPLLGDDGTVRTAEGYDPATRMFCANVPSVCLPESPTRQQAEAALLTLRMFLSTFAFADAVKFDDQGVSGVDVYTAPGQDESAALHGLLTAICRPSLWLAPALIVTAPALSGAGAGKGLLVRVLCAIALGLKPTALTAGHDPAELDKRLAAALVKAEQVIFLDNLNGRALKSDTLASAITERPAHLRVLGATKMATVAPTSFIAVTGNGLGVSEDMARRVLHVAMDPGVENPEARRFKGDILAEAFARRGDLLTAALTIWRWGRQAADIKPGKPIGSFEQWAKWVRDPLIALGCADPAERIQKTKQADPRRAAAAELFAKWNEHHSKSLVTTKDLHDDVKALVDPSNRGRQYLNTRIRSFEGTRAGGYVLKIDRPDGKHSADKFQLVPTQDPDPIGVIGGIGGAPTPVTPMTPMPPLPHVREMIHEGEI